MRRGSAVICGSKQQEHQEEREEEVGWWVDDWLAGWFSEFGGGASIGLLLGVEGAIVVTRSAKGICASQKARLTTCDLRHVKIV